MMKKRPEPDLLVDIVARNYFIYVHSKIQPPISSPPSFFRQNHLIYQITCYYSIFKTACQSKGCFVKPRTKAKKITFIQGIFPDVSQN